MTDLAYSSSLNPLIPPPALFRDLANAISSSKRLPVFTRTPEISRGTMPAESVPMDLPARSAPVPDPEWLIALNQSVRQLECLKPGWDGHGSIAISRNSLYLAARIVGTVLASVKDPVVPYFVPGGDGSVQVEWHQESGELELDIDSDGLFSIWGRDHRTGSEFIGEGERARSLFVRWAPRIAAKTVDAIHETYAPRSPVVQFAL